MFIRDRALEHLGKSPAELDALGNDLPGQAEKAAEPQTNKSKKRS